MNYIGTFPQYIRMALMFTDFQSNQTVQVMWVTM